MPFISHAENELKKKIRSINNLLPANIEIRPIFRVKKLINQFQNKDKIPSELKSSVVYQYTCHRCDMRYIGATKRHLSSRISEHLKGYPNATEVSTHPHKPLKENFSIIGQSKQPFILETILIKSDDSIINERRGSYNLYLNL